jgi:hypothetical protein
VIINTNEKRAVKLSDLLQLGTEVEVAPGQVLRVRPLNLMEIIRLFIDQTENFLSLYASGLDGKFEVKDLAPFLLSCPDMIAQIIAFASDEPDQAGVVQKNMPGTVQLIALSEIWKLSVPDAKKAKELLSEVTALLRRAQENQSSASPKPDKSSNPVLLTQ